MSRPHSSSDPWRRRVHALLAKAESTEFPEEAEALLAKAQELMTRHAIDEAMLHDGHGGTIDSERVLVEAPYAGPKTSVLSVVARSHGCRLVITDGAPGSGQRCVLVGTATGRAATLTMFAALSLHATRQLLAAEVPPFDTPRRFRHAFLLAFAARIGQRLEEANTHAEASVGTASARSVALVLADRSTAVDEAVSEAFPHLRTIRRQASSVAGARSGQAAAERAGLGGQLAGTATPGLPTG